MKYLRLSLCLLVTAMVLSPQLGRTDITPIDYSPPATGGGVSPKSPHQTIRLDDQEVIIRLKRFTYTVDALFHLSNTGETTTEWIGFPKNSMGRQPGPLGKVSDFIRFEVSVNDKIVPFTEERELFKKVDTFLKQLRSQRAKHSGWMMGRATFPGHATTTIRVRYESSYDNCGMGCSKANYIYGTGGYWKDSIRRATFIVDSTERGGAEHSHPGFSQSETDRYAIHRRLISDNIEKYEIRDFEPNPAGSLTFMFTERRPGKEGDIGQLVNACLNGRFEQVQALLKKGVDVNAKAHYRTPLMSAAWGGHLKVAKLLVEKGADVNAETIKGRNALNEALSNAWLTRGTLVTARFLRDQGAKPTTLAVAAFLGDMEAVRNFSAQGVNVDEKNTLNEPAPLTAAAMGGNPDVVNFLLDRGFKIDGKNEQGQTALMTAAAAGHAEVVKTLLDRGANISATDGRRRSVLDHAVFLRGHIEVIKVLLDRGVDINARHNPANRTILMDTAQGGFLEVVKLLIEKGADVNARDWNGDTALSLARGKDIEEIEKVLKAHGAK
ncbi:MAG: ankyrin repeat domain-containing protein [Thermodesulfobacteriota bacterium]